MMVANVSGLKSHLSRYLRQVAKGERILVLDRKEPVAELVPVEGTAASPREKLAREGRLRLATREFAKLKFSRLRKKITIQESLRAVREDH